MCDYSLEHLRSRPAKVGDKLVISTFPISITRGFTAVNEDKDVAVCLLPGTELAFDRDVTCDHALGFFPHRVIQANRATFREINVYQPHEHHDALEFSNGKVVLLTRLQSGQIATVLQLPVTEKPSTEVPAAAREVEAVS